MNDGVLEGPDIVLFNLLRLKGCLQAEISDIRLSHPLLKLTKVSTDVRKRQAGLVGLLLFDVL